MNYEPRDIRHQWLRSAQSSYLRYNRHVMITLWTGRVIIILACLLAIFFIIRA